MLAAHERAMATLRSSVFTHGRGASHGWIRHRGSGRSDGSDSEDETVTGTDHRASEPVE